ncbi:MAG TPA: PHB depolymerase family esterase [Ktedonobacterales bacterium]|jgi:poly(hydroxyalkanoate) depolymerase family esterase
MWEQLTYDGPGQSRPYWVYTPESYQPGTPQSRGTEAVPLLVMLHGCRQTPEDFAAGTRVNHLAEEQQFIVVYPKQPSQHNRHRCWNWFLPEHQARDQGEPASIVGIIQSIRATSERWTIDPSRIYAAGISAGGAMAAILGATYPDLFAAIGIHSGVAYQAATSVHAGLRVMQAGGAHPEEHGQAAYEAMGRFARVVPTIVFQGTGDYIVAPGNGEQVVQQWMQTNRLASRGSYNPDYTKPDRLITGQAPRGRSYTVQVWNDAAGNDVQAYWQIAGMGHAWSGGSYSGSYSDPKGPDASLALLQFFLAHPMPALAAPLVAPASAVPFCLRVPGNSPTHEDLWARILQTPSKLLHRLRKPEGI